MWINTSSPNTMCVKKTLLRVVFLVVVVCSVDILDHFIGCFYHFKSRKAIVRTADKQHFNQCNIGRTNTSVFVYCIVS